MAIPIGVKSKIPKGGKPEFSTNPLTTKLDEVPNKTNIPPNNDPYAMGIKSREATRLVRRAMSIVTGRNMAATPMLFIKADNTAALDINTVSKRLSVSPATRIT